MHKSWQLKIYRNNKAIIMPIIGIAIILIFSYMAFCVDIMYMSYLKIKMQGFASSCSQYVLSNLNNYSSENLNSQISNLINAYNLNYLKNQNSFYNISININKFDIIYNSNSVYDFSLRTYAYITTPFKFLFFPAIFVNGSSSLTFPNDINLTQTATSSPQPAYSINQSNVAKIFPIALNAQQIINIITQNSTNTQATITLNANQTATTIIPATFVDLLSLSFKPKINLNSNTNNILNQLKSLSLNQNYLNTPLDNYGYLTSYNCNYLNNSQSNLNTVFNNIPVNTNYIFPVISNMTNSNTNLTYNQIVGFTYLKLLKVDTNNNTISLEIALNQSSYLPNSGLISLSSKNTIQNNSQNTLFNYRLYNYGTTQTYYNSLIYSPMPNHALSQDYIMVNN